MIEPIVHSTSGVTVAGGGALPGRVLAEALALAPIPVAADGGARKLLRHGVEPRAVIGDLDSLPPSLRARLGDRVHRVTEQDSTDFEKCLQRIAAPFVIGVGLTDRRIDHMLAAFNALTRQGGRPVVILSAREVVFLCPPDLCLDLPAGMRVSLWPLGEVEGESTGLRWPIDGLRLSGDGRVGTSNRATGAVRLRVSAARLLVILPRAGLGAALAGLGVRGLPAGPSPDRPR